jgi:hypothetical protein
MKCIFKNKSQIFFSKLNGSFLAGRNFNYNKIFLCETKSFSTKIKKNPAICYYKILNISTSASIDEIKREYYKLAKKYHPDNNENSSANQTVLFLNIFI